MASLMGLAVAPLEALTLVVAVLGIALSSAFGISVALIVLTAPSSAATAAFSAVVQGVGYAVAALGPLVSGLFVGAGMSWPAVIAGLAGVALLELGFGIASARASLSIQRSQALEESEAHAVVGVGSPTQR